MDQLHLVFFPDRQRHYLRDPLGWRARLNLGLLDFVLAKFQLRLALISPSLQGIVDGYFTFQFSPS